MLYDIVSSYLDDPRVYSTAAKHAFEQCDNIELAREYITNGINSHSYSKDLYVEDFWMEVQCVHFTSGASVPLAMIKYKNFISNHFEGDIDFHFSLLDKALLTVIQNKYTVRDLVCSIVKYEYIF